MSSIILLQKSALKRRWWLRNRQRKGFILTLEKKQDGEDTMESTDYVKERRRYPRSLVDLPLEYRVKDLPHAHGGLVVNASEEGLLIHSVKDMPVGLKLDIVVLFPRGYELANFEVLAEIIWKDLHSYNDSEGYQYGLKITQMIEEDHWKLKQLLSGQFTLGEICLNL
jgi:PilZ domain